MKKNFTRIVFFLLALNIFLFPKIALMSKETLQTKPVNFTPQVTIPGSEFIKGTQYTIEDSTTTISKYVKAVYDYLLSIVGITAAIVLMVGGIMWLTAGGSSEKVSQAKSWISGSLTGMVLALTSYLILQTINPQLVSFTPTDVPQIKPSIYGCCQFKTISGQVAQDMTDLECYNLNITKAIPKIATTTSKILGKKTIAEYLGKELFDQEKRADYKTRTCKEMVYCLMRSFDEYGLRGEVVIELPIEECSSNIRHNATAVPIARTHEIIRKNELENRPEVKQVLINQCQGREGNSCKNSWAIYCYCYGGKAYFNRGLQNEPCGNDMGICVPNVPIKVGLLEERLCSNRDIGSRSCGGGLKCCEPNGLHGSYDPGDNYGVNVNIAEEEKD